MAQVERSAAAEYGMTDGDVMALHTERRLAEMGRAQGWFYRRYRHAAPRTRMFVSEMGSAVLAWFAMHGVFTAVDDDYRMNWLMLACLLIGVTIGSLSRAVPFRYR